MANLDTDLNVSPYNDDYTSDSPYYRFLFRPEIAVQARELTGLQSMLQEQITRHGDFNFKDGSIVDGCPITYRPEFKFVRVNDSFSANSDITIEELDSTYLITNSTNSNNAVRAVISIAKTGYVQQYPDTNRFYLDYIRTGQDGANNSISEFSSGDTLYIYNANQQKLGTLVANNVVGSINVITANATANATGVGYGLSVGEGVIYQKGFFIKVDPQTITVKDFDTSPNTYVVGFQTTESVITPEQDETLYDNAIGSPNNKAPGAHRLKLTPNLVAKTRSDASKDKNFFAIVEFDSDQPTEQNTGEEGLNKIMDIFEKRTSEESGDYAVNPLKVEAVSTANTQNFAYEVSSGIMYVNGARIEKLNSFRVETPKATTTKESNAQVVTANYGNYILVRESVGVFDFDNISEIALYDEAQLSVSQYEGSTTAPTGSIIGYANVRGFQYDSGVKGTPSALYRLYIFNVRMNSGKSFSEVRSVYSTSGYGQAKADIVLNGNVASIQDASNSLLVFPTGYDAIKRLRDSNGTNDNQYIFRDITSATLAANGVVTFTINTPANGGFERLNNSSGLTSDVNELSYNIVLSDAAYSANLAGTVDLTNANGNIMIGTGTSFATQFIAGDLVRVNTGAGFQIRAVTAVANNTWMSIDADIVAANTAAKIQKYYVPGHVINTSTFSGTVNILSNTQFTVDTNLDVGTGVIDSGTQLVYAQYPVLRTSAVEAKKEVKKNRFVKVNATSNVTGPWNLGVTDLLRVRNIYVGTSYADTNPERSSWFTVDNGQRDGQYDHARLIIKPQYKSNITSSTRILVELDYFTANTSTGVGFFSVDSYPIDDANTANTIAIQTAEIPRYYSSLSESYVDLRNAIDFRPRRFNTAADATTIAGATENPAAANTSFQLASGGNYIADPNSNFQADLEYYLPRIDLVCMNKLGDIVIRNGEPNEMPVEPKNEGDTAIIARANVPAYPSLSVREGDLFGRRDISVQTSIKTVKRYQMKDIRALEERISRMEYYTTLNLLEQKANDMVITDESGLDRFKNGIFADSFQSHLLGKVSDIEYSISIDKDEGIARPKFETYDVDFKFDSNESSNVIRRGRYVMLPYTSELNITQRFASKFRNCTESVWSWNGNLSLYPEYDHFRDEVQAPASNVTLDLTSPVQDFVNSSFGTNFGDWRTSTAVSTRGGFNSTSTTTTTTATRLVEQMRITGTTTDEYTLGNYVTDFSINPYMRSRLVAFVASGLKPNTIVHAFFDEINVDAHVAPGVLSGINNIEEGKEDRIVTRTGEFGSILKTDSNGKVQGVFRIPEGQFRTGDRSLLITDVDDLTTGGDAKLTVAEATYSASNLSVTKQTSTLTTKQAQTTIVRSTQTQTSSVTTTVERERRDSPGDRGSDPIAQTFTVVVPQNTSGMFVSQIGVYFKSKDPILGIEVYIMETSLGFPDSGRILGKARLESANVNVSNDSSVETMFVFDEPVYLENLREYAFMVKPDGNSPEYNIWISETGGFDIVSGEQIYSNPYSGILFVSANMNTWTANQKEDIKFNIYRARFNTGSGFAIFNNEDDEYLKIDGLTKANTDFRVEVGDVVVRLDSNNNIISSSSNANYGFGFVQYINEADQEIYLDSVTGRFAANTVIQIHRPTDISSGVGSLNSGTLIATSTITALQDIEYHAVVPRFTTLEPAKTSVNFAFKGTDVTYLTDGAFVTVSNDYDYSYTDKPRLAVSRSSELVNTGGSKTSFFKVTLNSDSTYLSPVVDLRRKSSLFIKNLINNDNTNEHTQYGNALTKYVSKNVTLDENIGNAEDMKALLGAYRPAGTDVEVYMKVIGSDDGDPFDSKLWTKLEMTPKSKTLFSSPTDTSDYREFEFNVPDVSSIISVGSASTAYLNSNGVVQYARADGSLVVGYKTFCFKIVLLAESGHKIPKLADFRAIALQA